VVVGLDDAVGGAALAGHVAEREVMTPARTRPTLFAASSVPAARAMTPSTAWPSAMATSADGELDGGVVVGLDDAVGGAALAGHVAEREVMLVVLVLLEGNPV
jgi:hypothetical protein